MADATVSSAELEDLLRGMGLIPSGYRGEVEITTSTAEGSDTITIKV
jgi:hypothetical protein